MRKRSASSCGWQRHPRNTLWLFLPGRFRSSYLTHPENAPAGAVPPRPVAPELPVHPATETTLRSSAAASRCAGRERVSRARLMLPRIWAPSDVLWAGAGPARARTLPRGDLGARDQLLVEP